MTCPPKVDKKAFGGQAILTDIKVLLYGIIQDTLAGRVTRVTLPAAVINIC